MKSIAILIPTLKKGGAEKQACILAKLLKDDYDVHLLVYNPEAGIEKENVTLTGLSIDKIIQFKGNKFRRILSLYKWLKIKNPDIIFCYLTKPDLIGPFIGKLSGVKEIYQGIRNAQLPFYKIILEKIGNLFSSGVILNNYCGVDKLKNLKFKNIIVIPNCYLNPKEYFEKKNKNNIEVITVGRFVPQKDYNTLLKAVEMSMEANDKLSLKIIGHGEKETYIRNLINNSKFKNRIQILINPPNIIDHLRNADIYISTSIFEGTSNSIMEAMDSSLPIVATNVGDNNRLVINEVNGFLTNIKDSRDLSDKILLLSNDYNLRIKFGKESNKIINLDFSINKFKESYLKLINCESDNYKSGKN